MLNKQKGQMYPWVTHTWNPIRGNCPHRCIYCYMKIRGDLGPMRLDEKTLNDNLSKKWKDEQGNIRTTKTIFVGSSTDMLAESVPREWLEQVLDRCRSFPDNTYVFQTKNPARYTSLQDFPHNRFLGMTLETNVYFPGISSAPSSRERILAASKLEPMFISIEPILDFGLDYFLGYLRDLKPVFVSIGADSQHHKLPEPPADKILKLIEELKKFTEVKIKPNLNRLIPDPERSTT